MVTRLGVYFMFAKCSLNDKTIQRVLKRSQMQAATCWWHTKVTWRSTVLGNKPPGGSALSEKHGCSCGSLIHVASKQISHSDASQDTTRPCLREAWVNSVSKRPGWPQTLPLLLFCNGCSKVIERGTRWDREGSWGLVPSFSLPISEMQPLTLKPQDFCILGVDLDARVFDWDECDMFSFQIFMRKATGDSRKAKHL